MMITGADKRANERTKAQTERRKRNFAFFIFLLILLPVDICLLVAAIQSKYWMEVYERFVNCCAPIVLILWFKGLYHWAKSKGRSGSNALWGLLFPWGFLVLLLMEDRTASENLCEQQLADGERRQRALKQEATELAKKISPSDPSP
jgi:hypothetical protein